MLQRHSFAGRRKVFFLYNQYCRQFIKGVNTTKKGFIALIVGLMLYYQGLIISNIVQLSPEHAYAVQFMIFLLAYILYKRNKLNMNRWLFFSVVCMMVSLIIGLCMNWYLRDILADVARFIAPFLGFAVGVCIFRRLSYGRIIYFLTFLVAIELSFYYYSIFEKIRHVYYGGAILEYAKYGLEVSGFFFFLFVCFLKKRILSRIGKILIMIYIFGFFLGPIMLMSKARTITSFFSLILVFLFVANRKTKLRAIVASLVLMCLAVQYIDPEIYSSIFKRAFDMVAFFQSGDFKDDIGTAVRVVEIKNVLYIFINNLPFSGLFGLGSGALWFEKVQKVMGGLHAGNFRDNGGLHHIFTASISVLFRYGIVGIVIILFWLRSIIRRLMKFLKYSDCDSFSYSICLSTLFYIFYAILSDTFVPVYFYGNIHFGFLLAIGYVVAQSQCEDKMAFMHDPLVNKEKRGNIENSNY